MCQKILQFMLECITILQISRACDPLGPNKICEVEYNTWECDYDWGDCCKASCEGPNATWPQQVECTHGNTFYDTVYGYDLIYDHCIDPAQNPDRGWNSTPYDILMNLYGNRGGNHKKTTSDTICLSVQNEHFYPVLGTWELYDVNSLDEMMSDLSTSYEYFCERNLTDSEKTACSEKAYISPDGKHYLTYCCVVDLWVIMRIRFDSSHADEAQSMFDTYGAVGWDRYWRTTLFGELYFAISKTGEIKDITTWYKRQNYWSATDFTVVQINDVMIFEGSCATAGWIINGVMFVLFITICVYSAYKIGIRNISAIQAARIEFIILGICFADSFISSIFITVPLPLHEISIGIVLLFFGVVNFICFALRIYITKAHIFESESIGSFSDFSFDFGLGYIFLIFSIDAEYMGFVVILSTYLGVVEEFAQLFRKIKHKNVQKGVALVDRFLEYSGRVLATFNMFILFVFCVEILSWGSGGDVEDRINTNRGWLWGILIWAVTVFIATIYSWYAYIGCCGKCGGHKEFDKREDKEDEEDAEEREDNEDDEGDGAGDATTSAVDKGADGRVDTVVDAKVDNAEKGELIHVEILHRHGDRIPIYFLQQESVEAQIWIPMIPEQYKWVAYDTTNDEVVYSVDKTALFSWQFINKSMLKYMQIVDSESESKDYIEVFTSNKSNQVPWSGLLTKTGVTQLKETGQYLRDRYINELGFLPHDIGAFKDNVYYQSTNDTRNIYSAESLLTTLYPGIRSYDQRMNLYIDRKHDHMFAPYDTKNRAQWKALLDKNTEFVTNNVLNPELQQVTDEVLAKFGKKVEATTSEMFLVQDSYTCLTDHVNDNNPVIVEEKENNVCDIALAQQLKKLVFKQSLYGLANNVRKDTQSLRYSSGALLYKIYNNMKSAAAAQDKNSPKCRIYSCHDETLIPLLCALNKNMENIVDLSDNYSWPPYGSTLCFEVWQKNGSTHVVKVRYDKKEITINGQSEMTLEELYSFWSNIMDKEDGRVDTVVGVKADDDGDNVEHSDMTDSN